jgi:nucleoside-diphosphate-sugar epimerase
VLNGRVDRFLVTGSSGHLGEALVRYLRDLGHEVVGLDVRESPHTDVVGSVTDRDTVAHAIAGARYVLHTATLHKPHIGSHIRQDFVDVNITGTLTILEAAAAAGVEGVVFTSSTSAFGRALTPADGAAAAWITEDVPSVVRNIYGATKTAAEDLCALAGVPVVVLRTSRFFPEGDDRDDVRDAYQDLNVKVNEFLYRRVDIQDVVAAHVLAARKANGIGFRKFVISATTPFTRDDLADLNRDAEKVVARYFPDQPAIYAAHDWRMFPAIDRVYVNTRARTELGWAPEFDYRTVLDLVARGEDPRSQLARTVGAKGYHAEPTGPYTT